MSGLVKSKDLPYENQSHKNLQHHSLVQLCVNEGYKFGKKANSKLMGPV